MKEAAANLMDVLRSRNKGREEDASSQWTYKIAADIMISRLSWIHRQLEAQTAGVCANTKEIDALNLQDNESFAPHILKSLADADKQNLDAVLEKTGTGAILHETLDKLLNSDNFLREFTGHYPKASSWLSSYRFGAVMGASPMNEQSPEWTRKMARLLMELTNMLMKVEKDSNFLAITAQLTNLICESGKSWLDVLMKVAGNGDSKTVTNSAMVAKEVKDLIKLLLRNPNLPTSRRSKIFISKSLIDSAETTTTISRIKGCESKRPCECTAVRSTFMITVPSGTGNCLTTEASSSSDPNTVSRFILRDKGDQSHIILADTSHEATFLKYGSKKYGFLRHPAVRVLRGVEVIRVNSETIYFPDEEWKELTFTCHPASSTIGKTSTFKVSLYAGSVTLYDNCQISEASNKVKAASVTYKMTENGRNSILGSLDIDNRYIRFAANVSSELLTKAATVTITDRALEKLRNQIESAATHETDFANRLTQAESESYWSELINGMFSALRILGLVALGVAIGIPLLREALVQSCRWHKEKKEAMMWVDSKNGDIESGLRLEEIEAKLDAVSPAAEQGRRVIHGHGYDQDISMDPTDQRTY